MTSERFDPGIDPSDCPPAKPIYGNRGRQEEQRPLEFFADREEKVKNYLQRHGHGPKSWGCPLSDVAETLEFSYIEVYKAADSSNRIDTIDTSGYGHRLRLKGGL